ncbi:unnamed protein product [Meloidogyne enterolobii]|uniref:Uncharacterized protein n=1 Tax=Meloidogyne enterolobii TaxID=390850 RepID=A0ACB1A426_MELEN
MTGFEEITNTNCTCECKEEDFRKFIRILCWKQMAQLVDLMELAPCNAYNQFIKQQKLTVEGLMFSGNMPVLRSVFGANSQKEFQEQEKLEEEENNNNNNKFIISSYSLQKDENTLKSLSFRLLRCVYPLLTGEKIVILASQQRTPTGMDLLEKLNKLRVVKRTENVQWTSEIERLEQVITEHQLSGVSCDKELSLNLSDKNAKHEMIIIDLNNHRIKCREYRGFLLRQLAGNLFGDFLLEEGVNDI